MVGPAEEHERRFGLYLNLDRVQAWEALAVAQGIAIVFGQPDKEFFEQIYENQSTVSKQVALSRRKGK